MNRKEKKKDSGHAVTKCLKKKERNIKIYHHIGFCTKNIATRIKRKMRYSKCISLLDLNHK